MFCIFLMTTAACFFGILLGELQRVYSSGSLKRREAEDHVDSVVTFLKGHGFAPIGSFGTGLIPAQGRPGD